MTNLTPEMQAPEMQKAINPGQFDNGRANREEGVLIIGVMKDSPARQAGLLPGDIVISIKFDTVTSALDVGAIRESPLRFVAFLFEMTIQSKKLTGFLVRRRKTWKNFWMLVKSAIF